VKMVARMRKEKVFIMFRLRYLRIRQRVHKPKQ
jgi:hypothetical protein